MNVISSIIMYGIYNPTSLHDLNLKLLLFSLHIHDICVNSCMKSQEDESGVSSLLIDINTDAIETKSPYGASWFKLNWIQDSAQSELGWTFTMDSGVYSVSSSIGSDGVNTTTFTIEPAFWSFQAAPSICALEMTPDPFWSANCISGDVSQDDWLTMSFMPNFDDPLQPMGDCFIEYILVNAYASIDGSWESLSSFSCQWSGDMESNFENFEIVVDDSTYGPGYEPIDEELDGEPIDGGD